MRVIVLALMMTLSAFSARAESHVGADLIAMLRGGGYVLLVRHTSSPPQPPEPAQAEPDNVLRERQLDDAGKRLAAAMGQALRRQHIPIGSVWSSPAYRARQTVKFAELKTPTIATELGDGGQSMRALGTDQGAWLRALVARALSAGKVVVIVTHIPNINAAYGSAAAGIADGEAMVFRRGDDAPVARIKPEDWASLATASYGASSKAP